MKPVNGAVASEPARDELSERRNGGDSLTREDRANLLRYMAMMRAAEERGITLYRQGKVPGSFYDGCGQEAISVGSSFVLGPRDRMCILHRDLGAHFVRGVTPDRYLANYMGRSGGVTGGKDGNMHFGDRELGCVGMVSMLPDMALVATGLALAFKTRGEQRVAMTYFGEGSTANGQWHEAMNFAGIHKLPVVFMLENNGFAYSTPNELEFAVDPVERAATYGFPGVLVDGNDVEAVFEASRVAAERARAGGGPTLVECRTLRMHGHGAHDDMSYVPEALSRSGPGATRSSSTPSAWWPTTASTPTRSSGSAPRSRPTSTSARRRRSPRRCRIRRSPRKACSPTTSRHSVTARLLGRTGRTPAPRRGAQREQPSHRPRHPRRRSRGGGARS